MPRRASVRGRIGAVRGYLATAGPLGRLIWLASPRLALSSAALAVLVGMLPAADIVIVSALLQTLVNAGRQAGAHGAGAVPHFLLLLGLLAGLSLVTQICERLTQLVNQLLGSKITHRMQRMVAGKAACADLSS